MIELLLPRCRTRKSTRSSMNLTACSKPHPRGVQLPGVLEEAKKINHASAMAGAQRLEPDSGGMTGVSEKTQQRMRSALNSVGKLVQEKAESKGQAPAALTQVVNAYLEDLPEMTPTSAALAQAQAHYWQLQRAQVVEEVAGTLKRHHEVASPPIDTLGEVVSRLGGFEQEVARCKVFAPQVRQDPYQDMRKALVEEIKTAVTFCETRRTSKTYATTIRITGSLNKVDDRWRNIRLQSPGQSDDYSRDGINLKPVTDDERTSFSTKQIEYLVTLGPGMPVKLVLAVHDGQQHDGAAKWTKVKDFDVTENRDKRSPLEPFGLPLHSRDKVTKRLQADGHDLEITFLDFSPVPALLWETAGSAKERTP